MPIQFDNYDQQKVDRLKNHLAAMAAKQKPKHYEIFVDGLKGVPKTDDPNDFDSYEDYMTPDTNEVRIKIYDSANTPRNEQYVFCVKAKDREEALMQSVSGLPNRSYSRTSLFDLKEEFDKKAQAGREVAQLKQDNKDLNDELDEKVAYIEELEGLLAEARANGNKLGGIDVGDMLSVALEGLIRRNTHLLARFPATKGLAGIIDADSKRSGIDTPQPEETQVSFKRKSEATEPQMDEQVREFVRVFNELQNHFTEEEFMQVMGLLNYLCGNKTRLGEIADFISQKTTQGT